MVGNFVRGYTLAAVLLIIPLTRWISNEDPVDFLNIVFLQLSTHDLSNM